MILMHLILQLNIYDKGKTFKAIYWMEIYQVLIQAHFRKCIKNFKRFVFTVYQNEGDTFGFLDRS